MRRKEPKEQEKSKLRFKSKRGQFLLRSKSGMPSGSEKKLSKNNRAKEAVQQGTSLDATAETIRRGLVHEAGKTPRLSYEQRTIKRQDKLVQNEAEGTKSNKQSTDAALFNLYVTDRGIDSGWVSAIHLCWYYIHYGTEQTRYWTNTTGF